MNISLNKKQPRIASIDLLKAVACAFVIIIHTATYTKYEYFIYTAVPIFICITGYNYSASFARRNAGSLKSCYAPSNYVRLLSRILVPYAVFVVAQLITIIAMGVEYKPLKLVTNFLTGGFGPGNYFLILFIQLLFAFPVLYYFNRKNPPVTALCCLIITFLYELIMNLIFPNMGRGTDIGSAIHKYFILRYLFFLESGAFFYFYGKQIKLPVYLAVLAAGLAFYVLDCCAPSGAEMDNTALSAQTLSIGIVGFCIRYAPYGDDRYAKPLSVISSASWHIFLSQQLYFYIFSVRPSEFMGVNGFVDILICFTAGLVFYYGEAYMRKLHKRLKSKTFVK